MSIKKTPNEFTQQALDTFVKLMRCCESVRQKSHLHLQQAEITESQLAVLEVIYHKGKMNQKEISQRILKSKSNMTTVIDNMLKSGLIDRTPSPHDKRHSIISLTPKGHQLIESIFPNHAKEIARTMNHLTLKEQIHLAELCKKLGTGAQLKE